MNELMIGYMFVLAALCAVVLLCAVGRLLDLYLFSIREGWLALRSDEDVEDLAYRVVGVACAHGSCTTRAAVVVRAGERGFEVHLRAPFRLHQPFRRDRRVWVAHAAGLHGELVRHFKGF